MNNDILPLLPCSSMAGVPFVDYLNVTVPSEIGLEVVTLLMPILEQLGVVTEDEPGVFRVLDVFNPKASPTFKFRKRGRVLVLSASGSALACLRTHRLFDEYLSVIAGFPHRVSMMHVTQDYFVPSPSAVILSFKAHAFAGRLSLTRKHLLPAHCKSLLSPDISSPGDETGTLYLGNRANADVWAKLYDKRQEQLDKGFQDPGPVIRCEVAVQSDIGATLRDAHNPHDIYFHFAGKSLVERPPGFEGWRPHGDGYALGLAREVLPLDRMDRLLASHDVARLVRIACELYKDKAVDVLARLLRGKCDSCLVAMSSQG